MLVGFEAGGHPGLDDIALSVLVRKGSRELAIPVIAAGGICDGHSLVAALAWGAEGVQMGTPFVLTQETVLHAQMKAALQHASEHDTAKFGPAEYCTLMLLGLIAASTVGQGSPIKGVAMMVLGLILGVVGTEVHSGVVRFSFDVLELSDGVGLIGIAMGLLALTEVIKNAGSSRGSAIEQKFGLRDQLPTREDFHAFRIRLG